MENKELRKHQSLKAISHDALFIKNIKKKKTNQNNNNNNENELFRSITHLPALSKTKSITTANLNIKEIKIKENKNQETPEKQKKKESQSKANLLLSNNFIEISRDSTGIIKRSLKNESLVDLIDTSNNTNKENIKVYTKANTREKKIIPQWKSLTEDQFKISKKTIPPINISSLQSPNHLLTSSSNKLHKSPNNPAILSPESVIYSPTLINSPNPTMIQSPLSIKQKGITIYKVSKEHKKKYSSLAKLNKSKSSSLHKLNKSKSSSLHKLNKSKSSSLHKLNNSKSSSIHKLNRSGSSKIEKNKKLLSKKLSSNISSNSDISIDKKKKIKDQSLKKKGSNNSINEINSIIKNNTLSKSKITSESVDIANLSFKNFNKENSYHNKSINKSIHNSNNSIKNSNSHIDNQLPYEKLSNQSNVSNSSVKNQNVLPSQGNQNDSFISTLSDRKSENFNKIISYPITSYQLGLYNWIDSMDTSKRKRNSYYYTVQCYQINKSLNPNIMKRVINNICDKYAVLKTRFYRNNKIIDANTEAIIDEEIFYNKVIGNFNNIKDYNADYSYFKEVRLRDYPKLVTLSESSIQQFIENWINSVPIFENQFKTFMFGCGLGKDWTSFRSNSFGFGDSFTESSNSIEDIALSDDNNHYIDPDDNMPKTFIAIVGSVMIADEISLNAIFNEIITLYSLEEMKYDNNSSIKGLNNKELIFEFKSKEDNFCFINYAQEQKENIDKTKVSIEKIKSFWKKQCTEISNDILLPKEKENMIEQLKKCKENLIEKKEKYNKLEKKKAEYEILIEKLTNDRIQLEINNGSVATVIDPVNGEKLEISNEVKLIILKAITGSETTLTIEPFLIKHEVSEHVRKCIRASVLKIEEFASLSDKDLEIFQLATSEKRKITALIDYVRNRIRECIQDQSKVKISIERHLSKAQREYDRCNRDYKKYEKIIEKITNDIIKINSILHPPLKITHIPVMQLQGVRQKSVDKNDWGEYNLYYSFMPLHLESDQNQYFQQFFDDWKNKYYKEYCVERCLRKKMEREKNELVNIEDVPLVEPDNDYLSEDDIYSSSENIVNSFYNNMPSTEAICLAIFSVLLRHISGIEKFILGIHQSQRRIYQAGDCIIGPLSNIIPIKIDLSQKGITFYNLFADLIFSIKKSRKINADHSYTQLFDFPDLPEELPIQFEFISKEECELWRKMGLKMEDLFSGINRNKGWTKNDISFSTSSSQSSSLSSNEELSENIDQENLKYYPKIKQLWSSNASNTFIFKLIMVEWDDDTIEGGILYSRNHFDEDQISKWIGKFETLIENIELGKPKVTVANLISRLYQNLRWKGSQMLLSSSIQLYDKRKILTTSLMHLGGANKEL